MKPLGQKAYGSIPHFFGSRVGPSDSHINEGQQRIMTEKTRDYKDLIIVQEKLDGSNCAVAKINGEIIPLTRAGYVANTSKYEQHHKFYEWVIENKLRFRSVLNEGERVCGEWLYQAHGTRYHLPHEPFVVFDIMKNGHDRLTLMELVKRVTPRGFVLPKLIHIGQPFPLKTAIKLMEPSGHGAVDPVEGVVYRCERLGRVDFLCKFVSPNKVDGKYLHLNLINYPL